MQKSGDNRVAFVGDDDEKLVGSVLGALEQRGIRAMRMPVASLKRAPRPPALTVLLESVIEDGGALAAESIGLERGPYAVLMGPGALAQRLEARQRGFHIIPRKDDAAEIADFIERLVSQAQIGSATTPDGLPLGQLVSSMTATLGSSGGASTADSARMKPEAQADARALASRFAKEISALAEKAQPSKPPQSVALDDLDWDDDPETVERPEGAALAEWRKSAKIRPSGANPPAPLPVPVPPPKRELRQLSPLPPPKRDAASASPVSAPRPPVAFGASKGRGLPRPVRAKEERRHPLRSTLPGGVSIPPELLAEATPSQPIELDDVTSPGVAPLSIEDVHSAITKPVELPDAHELTTRQIISPPIDEEETVDLAAISPSEPTEPESAQSEPEPAQSEPESAQSEPESAQSEPMTSPAHLSSPPSGMLPEAELATAFDEALADVDADVTAPQSALHVEESAEVLLLEERAAPPPPPDVAVASSASVPPESPSVPPSSSIPPEGFRAAGSLPPPPMSPEGGLAPLPPEAPVATPTPPPKRGMGLGIVVGLAAVAFLGLLVLGGAGALFWYLRGDVGAPIAASDPQPEVAPPTPFEPSVVEPSVEPSGVEPSAIELSGVDGPPTETVPTEAVPAEAVPAEAVPAEAVPAEAVPAEAVPAEAVPAEAVPAEVEPEPAVAPPTSGQLAQEVPSDPEVARERSDAIVDEAEAQERAGQLADARASFERAVAMYDRNPHAFAGLARVELAAGDAATAVGHAERAANLRRRRPEYQILVGDARRASGDTAGARRAYQRALDIDPTSTDAQERLAE